MIETVADTITQYYRERGFILAKAYIPKQEVRDVVVTLTVLLGNLGEVNVHNNQRYSSGTVKRPFNAILDKPVTRSEERRVGKECRYRWAAYDYKKKNYNYKKCNVR